MGELPDEVAVMILGRIHPRGVDRPLSVYLTAGVVDVYTCGTHTRVLRVPSDGDPRWDNGWGTDDPDGRDAIMHAVRALCDRVVRMCDQ